jgi:hypothetical protein
MLEIEKNNKYHYQNRLVSNWGIKEKIYIFMIFGISGLSLILHPISPSSYTYKKLSGVLALLFILLIGLSLSIIAIDADNFCARFLMGSSIVMSLIFLDSNHNKLYENIVIHLVNASYISVGFYFLIMKIFPENFPVIWQTILPSASQAFDMLILCLLFQNIGYYFISGIFSTLIKYIETWGKSYKNLFNISFYFNQRDLQIKLLATLIILGLITRICNFSTGNFYYTQGTAIPNIIGSLLSQFDRLFFIALLYGYALSLEIKSKKNYITYVIIFLLPLEFIYQLFSGSKGRFFYFVVLPLAMVFLLIRQKVSWKSIFMIGSIGIIAWLFIYPTLTIYRNLMLSNYAVINPLKIFLQSIQILSHYSWNQYIETILIPLTKSGIAEQVTAMTSIVHYQVSQDSNLLWQRLFLFWIPRFLWPDKPMNLSGNLIGRLSHRVNSEDFTTSVLTTSPGELFLYYGLWGSVLMILPGLIFRWLNAAISPFKFYTSFRVAVMVAYLPLMRGLLSGSFESGLTGIVLQMGVLYLTLFLVKTMLKPKWPQSYYVDYDRQKLS